jgi:fluoroquinolone transport system permease protein
MTSLLVGDIRFQFKYGFYFLYLVFSLLYIALLFALPEEWREKAAILMIFSDPAAMGLFFMGAIVLYEKSERVLNSIAVSPVIVYEYVLSKLFSIAAISTVVALVIGVSSGVISNAFYFILGVFLCSCLFSAIGIMIAAQISTLNQFILATIPVELVINIPAIAYLFGWKREWLLLHPGVCLIEMCVNGENVIQATLILTIWTVLLILLACRVVKKMFQSVGGFKL